MVNISDSIITAHDTKDDAAYKLAEALLANAEAMKELAKAIQVPSNTYGVYIEHAGS